MTDFSWANIHACLKSLNNLNILDYLKLCYDVLIEKKKMAITRIKTIIYLCSTHILKNIIKDTNEVLKKMEPFFRSFLKQRFVQSFILLQNCVSIDEFIEILKCIRNVFMPKKMDKIYLLSFSKLEIFLKRNRCTSLFSFEWKILYFFYYFLYETNYNYISTNIWYPSFVIFQIKTLQNLMINFVYHL